MKTPKTSTKTRTKTNGKKNRVRLTREHFDNLQAFDNEDPFGVNVRINDTLSMGDF